MLFHSDERSSQLTQPPHTTMNESVARPEHCYYCFQVLEAQLTDQPEPEPCHFDADSEYALFVTWNIWPVSDKAHASAPRLRGCIGTFEPQPLSTGLGEYARIAALRDTRFPPVTKEEVPRLQCGVSLLTGFEECQDYLDWEIGIHGIYIHLDPSADASSVSRAKSSRRMLTATYLPDVMVDQDWTKQEAIDSAMRKAGFQGRITDDLRKSLRVQRYRSDKVYRSYTDYQTWNAQNS